MLQRSLFFISVLFCLNVQAKDQFSSILSLQENQKPPKADLSVVQWLTGHWRGMAFGGTIEEIWAPALGGSMMGAFKLVNEGRVMFYEIETITEEDETLVFRLKHFHSDLKGWEEKNETTEFKLVKVEQNKIYFNGLTLEKINDNEINIYVAIEDKGITTEEKFSYKRIN